MRWLSRKFAAAAPESLPTTGLDLSSVQSYIGGLPPLEPDAQVIEFEAGDQLIVECAHRVPRDVFERLRAQLNEHSDDKVIVLEAGLKLVGRRAKKDVA